MGLRVSQILPTAATAIYTLALQVAALITLGAADFGRFSLLYLVGSLGVSILYSVVCEPWVRSRATSDGEGVAADYATVSAAVALAAGLLAAGVGAVVLSSPAMALYVLVAVTASTHRHGLRYFRVARGGRPWAAEGWGSVVVVVTVLGLAEWSTDLEAVLAAWAAGAIVTILLSGAWRLRPPAVVREWVRERRREIKPLLKDSLIMDVGAIGTPFLLAPVLGASGFGVYRSLSSVAAPVRLILNPLRPSIAARSLTSQRRPRWTAAVVTLGAGLGVAAAASVFAIDALAVDAGVLVELAHYWPAVGVFVAANFLGHYYFLLVRLHGAPAELALGRYVQTAFAVLAPLAGVAAAGVGGAIWGLAGATAVSAACWAFLAHHRTGPEAP